MSNSERCSLGREVTSKATHGVEHVLTAKRQEVILVKYTGSEIQTDDKSYNRVGRKGRFTILQNQRMPCKQSVSNGYPLIEQRETSTNCGAARETWPKVVASTC